MLGLFALLASAAVPLGYGFSSPGNVPNVSTHDCISSLSIAASGWSTCSTCTIDKVSTSSTVSSEVHDPAVAVPSPTRLSPTCTQDVIVRPPSCASGIDHQLGMPHLKYHHPTWSWSCSWSLPLHLLRRLHEEILMHCSSDPYVMSPEQRRIFL